MKIRESESLMSKKRILALALLAAVAAAISVIAFSGNENTDCASISEQASRNGCYHALAHSTGNIELCNNITDAEEREHCLGHIPE